MQISMYQASIPVLIRSLENLSKILDKAAAYAEEKKIDPLVLTGARLFPDMLPFTRQIYIATDNAKGCAARLSGVEPPKYEDVEQTIPELQARIAKTVAYLQSCKPEDIDGSEDRAVELKFPSRTLHFTGLTYLQNYLLPNFFFHVTTAYNILRHNGVEIGKRDYLRND